MDKTKIDGLNGAMLGLGFPDEVRARLLRALNAPERDEVLLKTREAAAILEHHPKHLLHLGRIGVLHPVRRSKRCLRWLESEVQRFRIEGVGK